MFKKHFFEGMVSVYNKCEIVKTCSICQLEKHSLEFHSNRKGRTELKPYCKACKTIYTSIKRKVIEPRLYIGKNYDTAILDKDIEHIICHRSGVKPIKMPLERAIQMVEQGGAHIVSRDTIECLFEWELDSTRIALSLRQIVYDRDGGACYYCGDHGDTLDHLIPRKAGGLNTVINLVCCCTVCNSFKADFSLNQFLKMRKSGEISDESIKSMKKKHGIQQRQYDALAFERKAKHFSQRKKCIMCEEEKYITKYSKKKKMCRKCEKFIEPFQRGWIDSERLSSITTDTKTIKGSKVKLFDVNMEESVVDAMVAKVYLANGVAEVLDQKTVRLLFTLEKINLLYPNLVITTLKRRLDELLQRKNAAHTYPLSKQSEKKLAAVERALSSIEHQDAIMKQIHTITSSVVSVFLEGAGCLGTLSKEEAHNLVLAGKAEVIKSNRIGTHREFAPSVIKRLSQLMPYSHMDSEMQTLLCERDAKLLVNSTISVFSKGMKLVGSVPLHEARKLVMDGDAVRNRKGSVTLLKKKPLALMREA